MIVVVAALVVGPDGRVLMVRKSGTDVFMNPGGKPEPGEDSIAALRRELVEEIGLDVPPESCEPLGIFLTDAANEPGEQLQATCFRIELGDPTHVIGAEIVESVWLDPAHPPEALALAPLAVEYLNPIAARTQ